MNAPAQAPPRRGVRLRALPSSAGAWPRVVGGKCDVDVVLVTLAVSPAGRRSASAPVVDEASVGALASASSAGVPVVALLDHAGPCAALWSSERALGPSDAVEEPRSGRRPLALDEAGWIAVAREYAAAAARCHAASIPVALAFDDDGLIHAALSPRTWPDAPNGDEDRRGPALGIHAGGSLRREGASAIPVDVDVALVVEELCPRGLDATDGIEIARQLVGNGAKRIYASAGTAALPALKRDTPGDSGRGAGAAHLLASAAWLVGRVDAEIFAVVPQAAMTRDAQEGGAAADPGALDPELIEHARALGLAGVIVDISSPPSTSVTP